VISRSEPFFPELGDMEVKSEKMNGL